jgi:Chromate transporter
MSRASQIISWATTRKTVAGRERAPLLALFIGFLKVSFFSTGGGGGIVFARRLVVEQRRWMDDHDFAEILSLCQFMPGPSLVGVAVWVGSRLRGMTGAIASLTGFTVIPLTIGFLLGTWCLRNTHLATLQGILGGVSTPFGGCEPALRFESMPGSCSPTTCIACGACRKATPTSPVAGARSRSRSPSRCRPSNRDRRLWPAAANAVFGSAAIGSTQSATSGISLAISITSISIRSSTVWSSILRIGPTRRFAAALPAECIQATGRALLTNRLTPASDRDCRRPHRSKAERATLFRPYAC